MAEETEGRKLKRKKYEQILGISPSLLAEARSSGVDERTIESYVAEQNKLISDVINRSGIMSVVYASNLDQRRIPQIKRAEVKTEIAKQPELQAIKQRRKSLVELEAKTLTKKTGRRALLTSPAGGSGFFGGYFNER
tara:strand:+ start:41 stop:451 length:411 start_codon:yes stop_codon:yes gene_type:complete